MKVALAARLVMSGVVSENEARKFAKPEVPHVDEAPAFLGKKVVQKGQV